MKKQTRSWERVKLLSPMGNWKFVAVDSYEKYFIQMLPFKRKNKNSIFEKGIGLIFPKGFTHRLSESFMNKCTFFHLYFYKTPANRYLVMGRP